MGRFFALPLSLAQFPTQICRPFVGCSSRNAISPLAIEARRSVQPPGQQRLGAVPVVKLLAGLAASMVDSEHNIIANQSILPV